jgi:hypothetical protein
MLPVVRHPRCVNCHGGIDPRTPAHKGMKEVLDGQDCGGCHNDVVHWDLPSPEHSFVGKSDSELCYLFAEFAMKQGHGRFISNHLRGDELVTAAFKGVMAGARSPGVVDPATGQADPPADPPQGGQPIRRRIRLRAGRTHSYSSDKIGSIKAKEPAKSSARSR